MIDQTELYREILLDHGQHPRGEGLLEHAEYRTNGANPDTGDEVIFTVHLAEDRIAAIGFTAKGSAVLRASCSLMIELLTGKEPAEAVALAQRFMGLLTGQDDSDDWSGLGDAEALRGIRQFPARVRCAVLPWRTFASIQWEETTG
ncbi:MAG: Fe-S cluster assembly sulfur transfer protein SufU [Puniceicoccales bacterium]